MTMDSRETALCRSPDELHWKETHMLVLSRKKKQSIVVNDNIVITVLDIKGSQVKLGIQAPSEVRVLRDELVAPATPPVDPAGEVQQDAA